MAPAGRFQQDVLLSPNGEGNFHGELSGAWNIGPIPNGGYVMAVATKALSVALDCDRPASITGHYLRPTQAGPVQVETEVIRRGRRLCTGVARLLQGGVERARFIGAFGDFTQSAGMDLTTVSPPELSDIGQCIPLAELTPRPVAMHAHLFARLDPASATHWQHGHAAATPEARVWLGFADGGEIDVFSLPLFADALPPPLFRRTGFGGWVPTVELTVHVHRQPAPGLLRAHFVTRHVTGGLLHEDGELWDSADRLVAISRQLAMIIAPPARSGNPAPAD